MRSFMITRINSQQITLLNFAFIPTLTINRLPLDK